VSTDHDCLSLACEPDTDVVVDTGAAITSVAAVAVRRRCSRQVPAIVSIADSIETLSKTSTAPAAELEVEPLGVSRPRVLRCFPVATRPVSAEACPPRGGDQARGRVAGPVDDVRALGPDLGRNQLRPPDSRSAWSQRASHDVCLRSASRADFQTPSSGVVPGVTWRFTPYSFGGAL